VGVNWSNQLGVRWLQESKTTTSTGKEGPKRTDLVAQATKVVTKARTIEEVNEAIATFAATRPTHGHVAFITGALEHIDTCRMNPSLQTYNNLLAVFPSDGKFAGRTFLDKIMPAITLQTECALKVLTKMEKQRLIPDADTYGALVKTFGHSSQVVMKCRRLAYWLRRFDNVNPFVVDVASLPSDPAAVSALVLRRVVGKHGVVHEVQSSGEPYILCVQTHEQAKTLTSLLMEGTNSVLSVEGPLHVWYGRKRRQCFVLRVPSTSSGRAGTPLCGSKEGEEVEDKVAHNNGDAMGASSSVYDQRPIHTGSPRSPLSPHTTNGAASVGGYAPRRRVEEINRDIIGVCMSETGTRESLHRWVQHLEARFPGLQHVSIVFDIDEGDEVADSRASGS